MMVSRDACLAYGCTESAKECKTLETRELNMALYQNTDKPNRPTIRCDELQGLTLKEIITEMTICVHCSEQSSHIFLLPCGHSMCSDCLEDFKTADQSREAEIWVPCPGLCDYTIVVKGGNLDPSIHKLKGVGLLTMLSQNDRSCEEHSRADDASPTSPLSSASNRSPPNARFICSNCDVSLCRSCAQQHCIPHPWEHRIQNLDDYLAELTREAFRCPKHGERFSIYCMVCEQPVCHVCCAMSHAGHKLKELSSGVDIRKAVRNTLGLLEEIVTSGDKAREEVKSAKLSCQKQQVKAVNAIREQEQRLIDIVEKTADRLVQEVTNVSSGAMETIESTDNNITGKQKMAKLMENMLSSALESDSGDIMSILKFYMENEKIFESGVPGLENGMATVRFVPADIDAQDILGCVMHDDGKTDTASIVTKGVLNSDTARRLSTTSGSEAPELPEFEAVDDTREQGQRFSLREIHKVPLWMDYVNASERVVSPCPSRVIAAGDGCFIIRERSSNTIIELSPNNGGPNAYSVTKVFRGCDKYFLEDPIDIALHEGHIFALDRAVNRQCLVIFDRTGRGKQVLKFDRKPNTICCSRGTLYVGFYSKVCCYTIKPRPDCPGLFNFTLFRTVRVDGKWPWHVTANSDGMVVVNLQGKELVCLHHVRKEDRVHTVKETQMEMRGLSFQGSTLLVTDRTGSRILSLEIIDDVPDLDGASVVLDGEDGVKNPVGLATGLNGEIVVGQENGELRVYVAGHPETRPTLGTID